MISINLSVLRSRALRVGIFVTCCVAMIASAGQSPAAETEAPGAGQAGWPKHLRIVSGPVGGEWHVLAEGMAKTFSEKLLPTTNRVGGGFVNVESIGQKNADIGFSVTCFLSPTLASENGARRIDSEHVALLVNMYPQVLYFILRKDFAEAHNITSVGTLLSQKMPLRFASLKTGTASEFILDKLFRYGYNTSFDQLRSQGWSLTFSNYPETADSFVAGDIDCFAYTASVTVPLILTMEQHTPLTVLPVEQGALDAMSEKLKTRTYTIQPGTYASVAKPIQTLADSACLIVRDDLPDDLVTAMCEVLWGQKETLAVIFSDFGRLDPEYALPDGIHAHPGAARFWKSLQGKK